MGGANATSPRTRIYGDVSMVIDGEFKSLATQQKNGCWSGPTFPNASTTGFRCADASCANGCLFNIFADPSERLDLSAAMPAKKRELAALLSQLNAGFFDPDRGRADVRACDQAARNGNFL